MIMIRTKFAHRDKVRAIIDKHNREQDALLSFEIVAKAEAAYASRPMVGPKHPPIYLATRPAKDDYGVPL